MDKVPNASPLDVATDRLLESALGLKGESVTLEYIRERRKARSYPVNHATEFGGRNLEGLKELTDGEVAAALTAVDELVDKLNS